MARHDKNHGNQLFQLLSEDGENVSEATKTLRGRMFERHAINKLTEGGVFRARWLRDTDQQCFCIQFAAVQQREVLNSLRNLGAGVYCSLASAQMCLREFLSVRLVRRSHVC